MKKIIIICAIIAALIAAICGIMGSKNKKSDNKDKAADLTPTVEASEDIAEQVTEPVTLSATPVPTSTPTKEATPTEGLTSTKEPTETPTPTSSPTPSPSPTPVQVNRLSIAGARLKMYVDDESQLKVTTLPKDAVVPEDVSLAYVSSDSKVATVSETGLVKAVKPGRATITAKFGNVKESYVVTVGNHFSDFTCDASVTLSKAKSKKITINYKAGEFTDDVKFSYKSLNESVAKVSNGTITAVNDGTTTVEVTAKAGSVIVTRQINVVVSTVLTSVRLSCGSLTMDVGNKKQLDITFIPDFSYEKKNVVWTSSDTSVAEVSGGLVTAKKAGQTTITATCGKISAKCVVTVSVNTNVFSISSSSLTLNKGQSAKLTAYVPKGLKNSNGSQYVFWSTFNNKVASVSESGLVTATGSGSTTIFAHVDNKIVSCTVKVLAPITGVKVAQSKMSLAVGGTEKCNAIILPFDATEKGTIKYTSSDETIAKVDANGTITGVSEGKCTITATCGNFKASIELSVYPEITCSSFGFEKSSVVINQKTSGYKLGYTCVNDLKISPNFSSSNENIVKVDSTGTISAVNSGSAVVTMSLGGKTSSCNVTVEKVYVVAIAPGHNDTQNGAYSAGYREEVLNLKVAKYCREYLLAHYKNVDVFLTREGGESLCTSDHTVDTMLRSKVAQDHFADLYVGMHFNAGGSNGVMVLVSQYYTTTTESKRFGNLALAEITKLGLTNRGLLVRTSSNNTRDPQGCIMDYYSEIKNSAIRSIPGVIIEHAYIDSAKDRNFFNSDAKLKKLGEADAVAIAKYFGLKTK